MFEVNLQEICENLEEFGISIDYLELVEYVKYCRNQQSLDVMLDELYILKWMSNDREYHVERTNGEINIHYIGNGLYGYSVDGKRFENEYYAMEYLDEFER